MLLLARSASSTTDPEVICAEVKNNVDGWINSIQSPSLAELSILSQRVGVLLHSIKQFKKMKGKDQAKLYLLEKSLEGVQEELTCTKEELAEVKAQLVDIVNTLNTKIKILEDEIQSLHTEFNPIQAKSITSAAERRFINFLLEGIILPENHQHRYKRIFDIIEDIRDQELPEVVEIKWNKYSYLWNIDKMDSIFRRLSDERGNICHKEERDSRYFEVLSEGDVRKSLSDPIFGFNTKEIEMVVKLHKFTSKEIDEEKSNIDEAC